MLTRLLFPTEIIAIFVVFMKLRVKFSTYVWVLTATVMTVLIAILICSRKSSAFFFVLIILIALLGAAAFWAPIYLESDDELLTVGSLLKKRQLAIGDMEDVELFQPTMGSYRLFASGGFVGYWGLFREGDIGRYMAYYGKASDCFLIRMKNGDKFVLGCDNPHEMVKYLNSKIHD